jgi:hypothetical protein
MPHSFIIFSALVLRRNLHQRPNSSTWDKSLQSFHPCYSQSPLQTDFTPPPPSKCGWKLILNVNIEYGNLKSENSKDYAHKPQWNCTFMNSPSGLIDVHSTVRLSQKSLRKMDRLKALFYIRSTKKPSRKNVVKNCLLVTLVFSWCANKYKVFNCNSMFCRVKTKVSECWVFILHQFSLKKVGGRKGSMLAS